MVLANPTHTISYNIPLNTGASCICVPCRLSSRVRMIRAHTISHNIPPNTGASCICVQCRLSSRVRMIRRCGLWLGTPWVTCLRQVRMNFVLRAVSKCALVSQFAPEGVAWDTSREGKRHSIQMCLTSVTWLHACVNRCTHAHTYTHTYTHMHAHIYTYIHQHPQVLPTCAPSSGAALALGTCSRTARLMRWMA